MKTAFLFTFHGWSTYPSSDMRSRCVLASYAHWGRVVVRLLILWGWQPQCLQGRMSLGVSACTTSSLFWMQQFLRLKTCSLFKGFFQLMNYFHFFGNVNILFVQNWSAVFPHLCWCLIYETEPTHNWVCAYDSLRAFIIQSCWCVLFPCFILDLLCQAFIVNEFEDSEFDCGKDDEVCLDGNEYIERLNFQDVSIPMNCLYLVLTIVGFNVLAFAVLVYKRPKFLQIGVQKGQAAENHKQIEGKQGSAIEQHSKAAADTKI